jgi:DNA-directed RNA polymerase subunit RPC12/RpoP
VLHRSLYEFTCICGRLFRIEQAAYLSCPVCGRLLIVQWRPDNESTYENAHSLPDAA